MHVFYNNDIFWMRISAVFKKIAMGRPLNWSNPVRILPV